MAELEIERDAWRARAQDYAGAVDRMADRRDAASGKLTLALAAAGHIVTGKLAQVVTIIEEAQKALNGDD
jgi:hypothetical protein